LRQTESVLADIYLSTNDHEAIGYDIAPDTFLDRVQYTSFTVLELSTLLALMPGVEWDVSLLDQFPSVLQQDGGERSIKRLPLTMIVDLERVTPQQILDLATKWAATEELACQPSDVQPIIESLARLAKKASASGQSVYFWNCV
jgi:hypothetical protein